ncbi:MAG: SDR family NAD(P)-dependent oxidoreductase, partial [Chloroflexota bacterium]|nr:SDR family NAD(P)-dependent oxidoreductase [Chloroflexota bacterium]
MEWPVVPDRPPRAGISGFGWSGTNAHVIVEGYGEPMVVDPENGLPLGPSMSIAVALPESEADKPAEGGEVEARGTRLLPLSGKSRQALREQAERYIAWLDEHPRQFPSDSAAGDEALSDMAWTASVGRSHFPHRAGVVFRDVASLRERLREVAEGGETTEGPEPRDASKVAFVYTGQGSQWVGMGQALYESEPVFRAVLDRCERWVQEHRGASLLDVMFDRPGAAGDLDDPAWTQPATYALQCGLTALWSSLGVRPDVVMGHSLGEIAASQTAGVFSLEDGLRFAATRGELMASLPVAGAMAAVFAPAPQVVAALAEWNAASDGLGLSIAADNGAHQVVSGEAGEVEQIVQRFEAEGLRVNRLRSSPGYHSVLVEPALDDLAAVIGGIAVAPPSVPLVSNVTGRLIQQGDVQDPAYWRRHARQPVAFRGCVETLAEMGVDAIVELGPHAVLGPMANLAWPESSAAPSVLSSLHRPPRDPNEPIPDSTGGFVGGVAAAYEAGIPFSFAGLFAGESRRRVALPGYPFQRQSHWVDESRRRRRAVAGHPLLGVRHESPRGETLFETEILPTDPAWLNDHRVFGRVIAPGALYGAMAAASAQGAVVVEEMQLLTPLVLPEQDSEGANGREGRSVQMVLDAPEGTSPRRFEIFSRGDAEEGWTLHARGQVSPGPARQSQRVDADALKAGMSKEDLSAFYRSRAEANINLGPLFRTLQTVWSGEGEAVGEIVLPEALDGAGLPVHPVLLDGCFQVMAAARGRSGLEDGATYLPFGWERLSLAEPLPERVLCHARMRESARDAVDGDRSAEPREVFAGDLRFYTTDGVGLGELSGYTVKRATRAALLSGTEGVNDLLYEVIWRDKPLPQGMPSADFLPAPSTIAARSRPFSEYLVAEGVGGDDRTALLTDLERLSWRYALAALEQLGWERKVGETVEPDPLRERFGVSAEHTRLFRRLFELLARAGIVKAQGDGFVVLVGPDDPLPDLVPSDPEAFADGMASRYAHGAVEVGLFRRSAGALADVLVGRADPLTLLFSSGEPTAADLYMRAPVAKAANRMLGDAVAALLEAFPEGRRLRVLEVGAGTGSATELVLPELPAGRFDYVYTDISAGFFAEAEGRFGGSEASIEYRVLDIEKDPIAQGYDSHGYDLVIASNVLHATRYLEETLAHCRDLLAPSGQLLALENLRGQGWLDLTFGQLDGWWRFADSYRPHHALASPAVWRQALGDAGFVDTEVLGIEASASAEPDRGVIMAQGPTEVLEPAGVWVLAGGNSGVAEELAAGLSARNQTVVLAGAEVEPGDRESWRSLLEGLPADVPLNGVVHLMALDGHGQDATAHEFAQDVRHAVASALALAQGVTDADLTPAKGFWLITRGGQVLEKERGGEIAGATLWGFGKVVAREAAHLQPRMIDLEPRAQAPLSDLVNELLYPDAETHIAYRLGYRQAARLVRAGSATERLTLSEDSAWLLEPDAGGALEGLQIGPFPARPLEPRDVRIAVEAAGLNFWDLFRALGLIDEGLLGGEFCGRVLEVGSEVTSVSVGERIVGLAFGTFGSEAITREEMVSPVPAGFSVTELATIPTAFVSAALSFDLSGLNPGDRVLIHSGAGGVGLAAIQLVQAAGAEVFATASAPKQAYLRSLGVQHVFDSRSTKFGQEILDATGGEGVHVVVNSLTGEGFIDASLSCLAQGGRFIELGRLDILTEEEMAAVRPDVSYAILMLDVLKEHDPATPGNALRRVMQQLAAGEVGPLVHSRWSMTEAGPGMKFMRAARHIGKIVFTTSPLESGRLREDRTYLVTGGLGGIGCALAEWLAERGAGTIVLNGRRPPDPEVVEAIDALRKRGVTVQVEIADVTDAEAVDRMLERIDATLPPLAGVIHSVGVLSDAALTNQTWERFEEVLWPKVLGAWHLHRATIGRDLDMFVLFSSVAGVLGNPGQANHAAANAFLDQLAGHRRALGLPGQTIAWGAWSGLGEAEEQRERIARQLEAAGTGWITPEQGLKAFDQMLRQDMTAGMVAAVDWPTFAKNHEQRPPLLEDLLVTTGDGAPEATASPNDVLSGLWDASMAEREQMLASFLQRELQAVMRLPAPPAASVEFSELGMDSLMAVELRNRLNRAFAGEYVAPNTVVFDYPSVAELARHLAGELGEPSDAALPERRAPEAQPLSDVKDGIAIVGMACRFPGAEDISGFWRQLIAGESAIADGREGSGDWYGAVGDPAAKESTFLRGAFVKDIDLFDSRFFRIAPIEARMMDPQQRMMLETSWQALEDAGIDPDRLRESRTGVYTG